MQGEFSTKYVHSPSIYQIFLLLKKDNVRQGKQVVIRCCRFKFKWTYIKHGYTELSVLFCSIADSDRQHVEHGSPKNSCKIMSSHCQKSKRKTSEAYCCGTLAN